MKRYQAVLLAVALATMMMLSTFPAQIAYAAGGPSVSVRISPRQGTTSTVFTVTARAYDSDGLSDISIYFDSSTSARCSASEIDVTSYTYSCDVGGTMDNFSPGTHTCHATATDVLGNTITSRTYSFTVSFSTLSSLFCTATLGGTWTVKTKTCTISTSLTVASSFKIPSTATLSVQGTLTIESGVTVANYGLISISKGVKPR